MQLAVLADAAYVSLVLVSSIGEEQLELATLHATVANFVERVEFFFKRGECMTVESSFHTTLFDIVVNRAVAGVG
ncbi:MAG: hypothetical protein ACKPKO_61900, partial [Candidatus Fonsibacter sp.]